MIRQLILIVGLVLLGFCLISVNVRAQPADPGMEVDAGWRSGDLEVRRRAVNFADLNLSREAGVKELYRRIRAAANSVCALSGDTRDLARFAPWRTCRETAIANAVAEIHHPLLSAHHMRLVAGNQRRQWFNDNVDTSR